MSATADEVFVYTNRGERIPSDVVRVRVDPSVTSIPARAFYGRNKLTEVELCEGLVEIGERSFGGCDQSITYIVIPNSLRRICGSAFIFSLCTPLRLHNDIESIGDAAFAHCIFTNFRVPPLITVIPHWMLTGCKSIFSLEVHEDIREIKYRAFFNCSCLRNVAFPPNAVISNDILDFFEAADLQQLFGDSSTRIIFALQHRFDGLQIHKIVYYQSYHQGVLQNLIAAINMRYCQRRTMRKLDPTGNQQDCLGMTPLHILACSSVHNLEMYRLIVENYPTNLITEDRWGATPLLYLFWVAAPDEIIQFLLDSYQSLYPDYVFNWTMMVETMGRCDTPKTSIENLLFVKQMYFPEQPLDWDHLLDNFASPSHISFYNVFGERMQFLSICGMSERMKTLAFQVWRDHITNMICTANFQHNRDNSGIMREIRSKLDHFKDELPKLKEATSILELVLWKMKIDEKSHQDTPNQSQKKIKTDESSIRQQCRITCGADVFIGHVLPYLINT